MAYGLYQGLNEAYDAFRGRQADIRAEKAAEVAAQREQEQYERDVEAYEYERGQRGVRERQMEAQTRAAELGVQTAEQQYKEFMDPAAIAARRETANIELEKLRRENEMGKTEAEWQEIKDRAVKGAEKYRDWKTKFMRGQMSMEDLVKAFNADEDDSNNVASVTGNEKDGWTITYEGGEQQYLEDKYAVAIELEGMADPAFHQQYLLQIDKSKQALNLAMEKAKATTPTDLLPLQKQWETNTFKSLDRLKGSIIKEGIVDFGTEGNKRVANMMADLINDVGQIAKYQGLSHANVVSRLDSIMQSDADLLPENIRKRAEEIYDRIDESALVGGKHDKGTPEYDAQIARIMERDVQSQMESLRSRLRGSYFASDGADGIVIKPDAAGRGVDEPVLESGASASEGTTIPEPEKADIRPSIAEEAKQYAMTEGESRDANQMISTRRQNYGIKLRRGKLSRPTAKQKKQLKEDFNRNYYKMSPTTQRAWLEAFGNILTDKERERAKEAYEYGLAEKQFGVKYRAEEQAAEEASRTRGVTLETGA